MLPFLVELTGKGFFLSATHAISLRCAYRLATCRRLSPPATDGFLDPYSRSMVRGQHGATRKDPIPPDFVVKCRAIDIIEIIFSLIW